MSWSKLARPALLATAMLVSGALLGACSFQPVYSGALATNPTMDIAYAKPTSRLEQVVYQELALRLGSSASETAPLATVSVALSGAYIGGMTAAPGPNTPARVTATATLTITRRDGSKTAPVVITRMATADYTTSNQVLASNSASTEAGERAARAAAESLRLAVLAELSR